MSKSKGSSIELVVQIRDSVGNPTGKTKTITSSSGEELETFWLRNSAFEKTKKPSKRNDNNLSRIKTKLSTEIDKLVKLERGWDGGSAIPLNNLTAQKAKEVVASLSDIIPFIGRVIPTPSGGVILEWSNRKNDKELEIEFYDHDNIRYLFFDPNANINEEKQIGINEIHKIRAVMQLLTK